MLTLAQVAVELRVSAPTIYRRVQAGELKAVRIGGQLRIDRDDLERFLREGGGTSGIPPSGDRDAPLSDCAFAARALPDEDPQVCRQLVLDWGTTGVRTIGEALDRLEKMTTAERRKLLDRTRAEVGLEPIEAIEARRRVHTINRVDVHAGLQVWHHPSCDAMPLTETGRMAPDPLPTLACPDHEHLADPADMDDLGTGVKLSPAGVLVPDVPAQDEREAALVGRVSAASYVSSRRRGSVRSHGHRLSLSAGGPPRIGGTSSGLSSMTADKTSKKRRSKR